MDEIIQQVQNDDDDWLNSDDDYFGDAGTTEDITFSNDLDPLDQIQIDDDDSMIKTDQDTTLHPVTPPPSVTVVEPQPDVSSHARSSQLHSRKP